MSEPSGALGGVRVISFGAFVAGNTAAKLMAELGADVVKVEPRHRPEVLRTPTYAIGDPVVEPSGSPNTVMFASLTRGTRNLSLDLSDPSAQPIFHRLVGQADIVIENFGSRVLERWGCGYDDLISDNPRLVMLSLSGYGRTGPRAGYLGYASTLSSYLGLSEAWGYTHGMLTDYLAAATGATAAIAALQRSRTDGIPAYVDVSQIESVAPLMTGLYAAPLNSTAGCPLTDDDEAGWALSGVFAAAGEDTWLAVDIEDEADWTVLCRILDRSDLEPTQDGDADQRRSALSRSLAEWVAVRTPFKAMNTLQKAGLAAAVVQSSEDIWRDPQLHVRRFPELIDQVDLGPVTYPGSVQRWTKAPGRISIGPARLGQHTHEILRDWLDLTDDEIQSLVDTPYVFDANSSR